MHGAAEYSAALFGSFAFAFDRDDIFVTNSQVDETHHGFHRGSSSFLHFEDSQNACKLQPSASHFVSDMIDIDWGSRRSIERYR
jgi:hypothetical protein